MVKWLLLIVGGLLVIVGGVVLVGANLPQNHTASRSIRFSAPPDSVWSVITNVAAHPSWRLDLDSVEVVPSTSGNIAWREVSGGDRIALETEVMERPAHLVARIAEKGIPFGGSWDYRIEPNGTGSRLTITEHGEVYNPVFRFVSRYVMGHTATIDKYIGYLAVRLKETPNPGPR